ncbi:MAG: JmjC domain-containing protein [Methylophilaceae bacterium]
MDKPLALLNNLSASQFLAEYWQKKPLLIKHAIPNFKGLLSPNELAGLACEEDVQARIIQQRKGKWSVKNGPFTDTDFAKLPKKDWTLLVQSVNHYLAEASDLLAQFNFIPHARLDDLMVSYAPDSGGVGAHVDSYDVFLLQGSGKRRWQISAQNDLSLVEGVPIKILQNFKAEQEWLLEAGDMLYLPPKIAHWGVAEGDDCMTYSIGFRAPAIQELIDEFLIALQDHTQEEGLYEDADLTLQDHPAEISDAMVNKVNRMLEKITWEKNNVAEFLGKYLTEPKPDIVFEPNRTISVASFAKKIALQPLRLHLKSQLLFYQNQFYLNGEFITTPEPLIDCMRNLADHRYLDTVKLDNQLQQTLAALLCESYLAGFLDF